MILEQSPHCSEDQNTDPNVDSKPDVFQSLSSPN
jgi:hypothetical protein